jgi:hypothetical protein
MKTKALVCGVVFFVVVLVGVCSFAVDKEEYGFYVPRTDEVIFGTWVNTEYSGQEQWPQKFINYRWGSYDVFMQAKLQNPSFKGSGIIVDKWEDAEGNTWYKMYSRENWTSKGFFAVEKINKDGNVEEFVWKFGSFPTEDDLNSKNEIMHYRVYYRQ